MCDDDIEQLLAQVNEFIIEELNDDTFSQLLLMLAEKELRDEAERSSRLRIQRGREEGHCRLVADYFCDEPVFPPCKLRRRFRMNKVLVCFSVCVIFSVNIPLYVSLLVKYVIIVSSP
ncbi:hypothetical protein Tco_0690758 [Tanacetum coccineum]